VLNANQPKDNYWIRAEPNAGNSTFLGGLNSAILRYANASEVTPNTTSTLTNPMLETDLHPLENPGAPGIPGVGNADVNIPIIIGRNGTKFTVNNATFDPDNTFPALLQIISGASSAQELLPKGSYHELPLNSVIELTIPGGTAGNLVRRP